MFSLPTFLSYRVISSLIDMRINVLFQHYSTFNLLRLFQPDLLWSRSSVSFHLLAGASISFLHLHFGREEVIITHSDQCSRTVGAVTMASPCTLTPMQAPTQWRGRAEQSMTWHDDATHGDVRAGGGSGRSPARRETTTTRPYVPPVVRPCRLAVPTWWCTVWLQYVTPLKDTSSSCAYRGLRTCSIVWY